MTHPVAWVTARKILVRSWEAGTLGSPWGLEIGEWVKSS